MQFTAGEDLQKAKSNAPIGICLLNADTYVAELVNDKFLEVAGKPYETIFDKFYWDAFAEVRSYYEPALQELLLIVYRKCEQVEMNELLVPVSEYEGGHTGSLCQFHLPARRDNKDQIGGILGIVFEVTGMMKVQQELSAARAAADQQKRVYETITSGTPDLMYVWDLDYRFTYVNGALLQMWGKTWDSAVGKGLRENGYQEWHAQMHEREIDSIVRTKQPVCGEVSFPHAVLGKRVYDYILVPVFNESGEVEALAGTTRDVTERKKMEEALAKSSEELQTTNEQMAIINEELTAIIEDLAASNEEWSLLNHQLSAARQKVEESDIMLRLAIDAANFGTWFIHSVINHKGSIAYSASNCTITSVNGLCSRGGPIRIGATSCSQSRRDSRAPNSAYSFTEIQGH